MQQIILTALIGFASGIIPSILLYLTRKKELAAQIPLQALEKISEAEDKLREDLMTQIAELRTELKELKLDHKMLHDDYQACKQDNFALIKRVEHLELLLSEQGSS